MIIPKIILIEFNQFDGKYKSGHRRTIWTYSKSEAMRFSTTFDMAEELLVLLILELDRIKLSKAMLFKIDPLR